MVMHGELYRLRPPAHSLTAFYLCTSGGGALGGLAVGLVAPRVFDGFYELPIGLALAGVLLLLAWRRDPAGWLARTAPRWHVGVAAAVAGAALVGLGWQTFARPENLLFQERSFFGVLRVHEIQGSRWRSRILVHGTTLHGIQIEAHEDVPTAYFGRHTGIETALQLRESNAPTEIGVIGLGAGTLAAYGRPGDRFRFFEIDPAVIRVARDPNYFTYLARSAAQVEIVLGDGRISLARERAQNAPRFDYLIVDAYSGDAVPVHLLTREAIALYADSIRPDGYLVFHASTRFYELVPMLFRLAADAGLYAVDIENGRFPRLLTNPAIWVFMSRREARIRAIADAAQGPGAGMRRAAQTVVWPTREVIANAPLWTDDYSNLLRVLRQQPTYDGSPTEEKSR